MIVQVARLLVRLVWFVIRHPLLDVAAGGLILLWLYAGWPGVAGLGITVALALLALRI